MGTLLIEVTEFKSEGICDLRRCLEVAIVVRFQNYARQSHPFTNCSHFPPEQIGTLIHNLCAPEY